MNPTERLYRVLDIAPAVHRAYMELRDVTPAPESPFLEDRESPLGDYVLQGAFAGLASGLDHLMAWSGMFRAGVLHPTHAHFTMLRSTVEGLAQARWIIDPNVESRVRLGRGVGSALDDLRERRIIEDLLQRPVPDPATGGKLASERIVDLEAKAATAGVQVERIKHTEAARRYGLGEVEYRLLCAFAHGGQAIPLTTSLGEVTHIEAAGMESKRMEANLEHSAGMTHKAADVALATVSEMYIYYGHRLELRYRQGPRRRKGDVIS